MTVKVYTTQTRQMLLSVSFTSAITAMVMDNMETMVYAGTKSGQIHSSFLLSPPKDVCHRRTCAQPKYLGSTHWSGDGAGTGFGWLHTGKWRGGQGGPLMGHTLRPGGQVSPAHGWSHSCTVTPPALLDHDRWSPGVKLVVLQKGTNQKEFTCAVLTRTDFEDWMRDEKVLGGSATYYLYQFLNIAMAPAS